VRFALAQPEHYRLSTMISRKPGSVDEMIQDTCFQQLLATVEKCTEAGIFPKAPGATFTSAFACGPRRTGGVATCHQAMAAVGDVTTW